MPAFDEETFGPVVTIIRAETEGEAFQIAGRSKYGLGALTIRRSKETIA
jgi:succinate-semialdehyde dehydrogenase/glutarate-semialdehyde dehydrogenase